jgi:histone H3/H4
LQRAPVDRFIRMKAKSDGKEIRFSPSSLRYMQLSAEESFVKLAGTAYYISINKGTKTLTAKDIGIAKAIHNECFR